MASGMFSNMRKLPSPRNISPLQKVPRNVRKPQFSPNILKQQNSTPVTSYLRAGSSSCYTSAHKQLTTSSAIINMSPINRKVVRKLELDSKQTLLYPTKKIESNISKIPTIAVTEEEKEKEWRMLLDTPKFHQILYQEIKEVNRKATLGRGSFGTVIKARYKDSEVAVKVVPTKRFKKSLYSLWNEKNAIKLTHPNIVKVLCVILSEQKHGLVLMEMCHGQDLQALINDPVFPITNLRRVRYGFNVAEALKYCHDNKVLHLDVKPCNILVRSDFDTCKLCDFGSSCIMDQSIDTNRLPNMSTAVYADPNIFKGQQPTEKSDIYSLGIVLWQLLSREDPYEGYDVHTVIFQVGAQNLRPRTAKVFRKIYHDYVAIYEHCWQENSQERPTSDRVAQQLFKILKLYRSLSQL